MRTPIVEFVRHENEVANPVFRSPFCNLSSAVAINAFSFFGPHLFVYCKLIWLDFARKMPTVVVQAGTTRTDGCCGIGHSLVCGGWARSRGHRANQA